MTVFTPIIKTYTLADIDELQKLAIRTFEESYAHNSDSRDMEKYMNEAFSLDTLQNELLHAQSLYCGIWAENKPIAYMKINLDNTPPQLLGKTCIEIQRIYILKAFQGFGLGTLLMEKAEEIAKKHQRAYIWLVVWDQNTQAVQFYQKKGFEMNGTVPFVFGYHTEDDCCMVKKIKD